jgi:hypothetical protein
MPVCDQLPEPPALAPRSRPDSNARFSFSNLSKSPAEVMSSTCRSIRILAIQAAEVFLRHPRIYRQSWRECEGAAKFNFSGALNTAKGTAAKDHQVYSRKLIARD